MAKEVDQEVEEENRLKSTRKFINFYKPEQTDWNCFFYRVDEKLTQDDGRMTGFSEAFPLQAFGVSSADHHHF